MTVASGIPGPLIDTQVTYRQLDHWVRRGYLRPTGGASPGIGNARDWSADELGVARLMIRLVQAGFRPEVAADLARELHRATSPRLAVSDHVTVMVTP